MTLADYVIFTAVAEHRNMTHASEKLHLTRSAISHAVSRMEQELGFSLFIKTTHGISLTTNGEMLLPLAYSVIQSHNHFHETVSSINGLDAGHVRLGTCSSTCINWVPQLVHTFRTMYPAVELHIFGGANNAQILAMLEKNEIDLGIAAAESSGTILATRMYDDEMVCVTNTSFATRTPGIVTPEELAHMSLILSDQDYGEESRIVMNQVRLSASPNIIAIDDAGLVALVSAGLGYCIIGRLVLKAITSPVRVFSFDPPQYRRLALLEKRNLPSSPAIEAFKEHILRFVETYPNPPEDPAAAAG
ncbi:MAG: LysR family transcriptional regulator [Lachnospiraceae bacterium]|jgi:DNA-binding transcriptional LysR family regulator|nr:LysR family transcriptional regulator [Lachnospiraceae bacterium]